MQLDMIGSIQQEVNGEYPLFPTVSNPLVTIVFDKFKIQGGSIRNEPACSQEFTYFKDIGEDDQTMTIHFWGDKTQAETDDWCAAHPPICIFEGN